MFQNFEVNLFALVYISERKWMDHESWGLSLHFESAQHLITKIYVDILIISGRFGFIVLYLSFFSQQLAANKSKHGKRDVKTRSHAHFIF